MEADLERVKEEIKATVEFCNEAKAKWVYHRNVNASQAVDLMAPFVQVAEAPAGLYLQD